MLLNIWKIQTRIKVIGREIEKSRRVAIVESRPVCLDLNNSDAVYILCIIYER
jgi:hypothetical protein